MFSDAAAPATPRPAGIVPRHLSLNRRYLVGIFSAAFRNKLLAILLAMDLLLILLHIAVIGFNPNEELPHWASWVRLNSDRSAAEIFEYSKCIIAGFLLIVAAFAHSRALVWSGLIALFLGLDNWLSLHERFAATLFPGHQNRGELAVSLAIGLVMAVGMGVAYLRANGRERAAIVAISLAVALVGMLAAGVDAVHAVSKEYSFHLGRALLIVEDGGELIAQSLLLVVAVIISRHARSLSRGTHAIRQ